MNFICPQNDLAAASPRGTSWRRIAALALCALSAACPPAQAHKASDAYLRLAVQGSELQQRTDIALRDLDRELVLDADEDGQLSWGEVRRQWPQIDQLAQAGITFQADGQACVAGPLGPAQLEDHSDGAYAVLTRSWRCPAPVRSLAVSYQLFAGSDPTHRGMLRLAQGGQEHTAVLVPGSPPQVFAAGEGPAHEADAVPSSLVGFIAEGVHHILIGTDHVVFLLALLLPAVLRGAGDARLRPSSTPGGGWGARSRPRASMARSVMMSATSAPLPAGLQATLAWPPPVAAVPASGAKGRLDRFGPVLGDVAKVVTAFTVAHSITLALAVLGWVQPPSRWVESLIAVTVALAALDNLRPFLPRQRWKLTFVFGLVHGFGFATALRELGLAPGALATSLLGFNLGVELGQLAIVALFLPLAWWARDTPFYRRVVLGGGSVAIAVLALLWLVERALDLKILG